MASWVKEVVEEADVRSLHTSEFIATIFAILHQGDDVIKLEQLLQDQFGTFHSVAGGLQSCPIHSPALLNKVWTTDNNILAVTNVTEGRTVVMESAAKGRPECLKLLLSRYGCLPNMHSGSSAYTALHLAAFHNHVDCVRLLLAYGADPSIRNRHGEDATEAARAGGGKDSNTVGQAISAFLGGPAVLKCSHVEKRPVMLQVNSSSGRGGEAGGFGESVEMTHHRCDVIRDNVAFSLGRNRRRLNQRVGELERVNCSGLPAGVLSSAEEAQRKARHIVIGRRVVGVRATEDQLCDVSCRLGCVSASTAAFILDSFSSGGDPFRRELAPGWVMPDEDEQMIGGSRRRWWRTHTLRRWHQQQQQQQQQAVMEVTSAQQNVLTLEVTTRLKLINGEQMKKRKTDMGGVRSRNTTEVTSSKMDDNKVTEVSLSPGKVRLFGSDGRLCDIVLPGRGGHCASTAPAVYGRLVMAEDGSGVWVVVDEGGGSGGGEGGDSGGGFFEVEVVKAGTVSKQQHAVVQPLSASSGWVLCQEGDHINIGSAVTIRIVIAEIVNDEANNGNIAPLQPVIVQGFKPNADAIVKAASLALDLESSRRLHHEQRQLQQQQQLRQQKEWHRLRPQLQLQQERIQLSADGSANVTVQRQTAFSGSSGSSRSSGSSSNRASSSLLMMHNSDGGRLLQSMGWRPGEGLGKQKDGIMEPIQTVVRQPRQGLGVVNGGQTQGSSMLSSVVSGGSRPQGSTDKWSIMKRRLTERTI